MNDLTLHVKREYFDQIKSGEKKFECRANTPYWRRRIMGEEFGRVIICLGYPSKGDHEKRLVFPWKGFEVQTIQHPHFGEKPVVVFAIRLEERI